MLHEARTRGEYRKNLSHRWTNSTEGEEMNESNVDGPMACEDCGKVCQGIQGIRGHRRSCPVRKQVVPNRVHEPHESVVEPVKPVALASNQQILLGTRLDAKGVEVVLRTYEPLQILHNQIRDALPIRQSLDGIARANKWPTYGDWFDLGRNVVRLKLATEHILQRAYVSRDEPWNLYQLAIKTRDQWVVWRREEAHGAWKQRCSERGGADKQPTRDNFEDILADFGIPELEANWNNVIGGLRWLTSHTKATL